MFKQYLTNHSKFNDKSPISKFISPTNRAISPTRNFRTEKIIVHKERTSRSPIRNRPTDIVFLKNYIDINLIKRKQTTPTKLKSPIRDYIKQPQQKCKFPKKKSLNQNLCCSPIKSRPFNDIFKQNINPYYFQTQTNKFSYNRENQMTEIQNKQNRKQNLQLFTQLLDQIKLKQHTTSDYMKNYSTQTQKTQEIKKPQLKQFTWMLKNKQGKCKENQVETSSSKIQQKYQFKKPLMQNQQILNFSLGNKKNIDKKIISMPSTTNFSPILSTFPFFQKIIIKKQVNSVKESQDSLSKHDKVNQSQDSIGQDNLNMDPCF